MKLQYLKYFCVLAEELHFRRAALRLAISQPPLSAAIKALEEEMGAQLFLRNSKMVQLTPAGAAFLTEAQEILTRVSRVSSVVKAIDAGAHGRLDVGMVGSLLYREIPAILQQFRKDAPGVDLVLHELRTSEMLDQLQRRQIHAGFVHGAAAQPPLKSLPLGNDLFVLCLPERHPMADAPVVELSDLADEDFVMFSRDGSPANHDNVIAVFSRAGIHPRTVHQARIWMTIVAMVAQGIGLALVPASLAKARIAGVRFVPLKHTPAPSPAMLAWNPAMTSPALTRFIASAERTIQSLKPAPGKPARTKPAPGKPVQHAARGKAQ